jgi:excisionase family DNA binding protein
MSIPLDLANVSVAQPATATPARPPAPTMPAFARSDDLPAAITAGGAAAQRGNRKTAVMDVPDALAALAARIEYLEAQRTEFDDLRALVADLRSITATFNQPKAELLSKSEAARLLGVHRTETLPKLIRDGVLKTIPFGKRERISRDDIERVKRQGLLAVYAPKAKKKGRPPKQAPESTITLDSWRPTAR